MTANLSVIILTRNEEANIGQALLSVCGWAKKVFIVDSFSEDTTVAISRRWGGDVYQFAFEGYSQQRNRALTELPIETEWILFLDADEWIPDELKHEITLKIANNPVENGFYLRRRFYWMGSWIRRGYYPVWILRLFRHHTGFCEDRSVNEHMLVEGPTGCLQNDFVHEDRKSFSDWIEKHNRYALREANELFKRRASRDKLSSRFLGTQAERVRWLRENIYNILPPLLRPFLFFGYRVVIRGGILDGWKALLYHFFQALWYPLLVDIYYLEMKRQNRSSNATAAMSPATVAGKRL